MSLKTYRELAGLTQKELALLSGIKQQTISLIERAADPNVELKTARALVSALNALTPCAIDDVFPQGEKAAA